MLNINADSWHARTYAWWHLRKYGYRPSNANLCNYVRSVLLWAPLRWLFVWGTVGKVHVPWASWTFLVFSPFLSTPSLVAELWANVLLIVFSATAIALSAFSVAHFFSDTRYGESFRRWANEKTGDFADVVAASWEPIHDRICPIIELRSRTYEKGTR